MNHTTVNTTQLSCGFLLLPANSTRSSLDIRAVFIFRIAVNVISCPFVILLNILVMVAVKTKRQLRTKSNVALACLATTDLVVGLVVQPLQIASHSSMFKGETDIFCNLVEITRAITIPCVVASLNHCILLSTERYFAIKHSFAYENHVTEVRIIIASGLAWAAAIILSITTNTQFFIISVASITSFILLPLVVYFNVSVFREVRRNEKQIITNQVSLQVKERLLKNKKAFYITTIVLLAIFLCYFPVNVCFFIVISFKDSIPVNVTQIMFNLVNLFPVLNSLFNPLIYAVRIRSFRVAFIQLLSRKTITQAQELERNIFGRKQIGVVPTAEQGENRVSREDDVQQVNDIGH